MKIHTYFKNTSLKDLTKIIKKLNYKPQLQFLLIQYYLLRKYNENT